MVKDLEKRLQLLRRQVYGKNPVNQYISKSVDQRASKSTTPIHRYTEPLIHRTTDTPISSDLTYLHQDLLKILILASLAIGAQVILFILSQNHILNLNLL